MAKLDYAGPNAQQIEYWNDQSGAKWVALQEVLDEQIAPLGRRAMDRTAIAAGERVLDVGCGCGQTSIELAQRVGPRGAITGADISNVMLERARARAREAGLANTRFEDADAQTHAFDAGAYDVVFSRFGIMFFADSVAAFTNLARALRPGGRVAFVCWRSFPENPWMAVPIMAALQHVPPPPIPDPDAPGPFRFADPDKVRAILASAGFSAPVVEPLDEPLTIGGSGSDLDRAVGFLLQIGPLGTALREAGPEAAQKATAAVRASLEPYHTPQGIRMSSASWIVTASKP
jgi:SAM-dependent methyltransferase